MTTRLTGQLAVDTARRLGLALCKSADPLEGSREGLSVDEAAGIAATAPSLIWLEVDDAALASIPPRFDVYRVLVPGSKAESWSLHRASLTADKIADLVHPESPVGEPHLVEDSIDWAGGGRDVVEFLGYLVLPAGSPHPERFRLREANDWTRDAEARFRAAHDAWRQGGMLGPSPSEQVNERRTARATHAASSCVACRDTTTP